MKIGELARRSGQTQSRIRFYERIGLLTMVDRRSNGYRTYPPEAVAMLEIIDTAQQAGFSLDEIRALVPANLEHWRHDAIIEALQAKLGEIEALEQRLTRSKAQIKALIADIEARPDDIDCAENARRVMARLIDSPGNRSGNRTAKTAA